MWEVVGGYDGGVSVWGGKDLMSEKDPEMLLPGALLKELRLEGNRIWFWRVAGQGPEYGWTSIQESGNPILERTKKQPWDYKPPADMKKLRALVAEKSQDVKLAWPVPPNTFMSYHCTCFCDSKPAGLRASACVNAMEELRMDLTDLADMTVSSFADVTDPIVELAVEISPQTLQMSDKVNRGLQYTHPGSKGAVLSWLRMEAQVGFPSFPLRTEEQKVYLVGKNKLSTNKPVLLATGRFCKKFTDVAKGTAISGKQMEQDFSTFWAKVRNNYSSDHLNNQDMASYYPGGGKVFKPTLFTKTAWRMPHAYSDLAGGLFHARIPEVLWDINTSAGGKFQQLVASDENPDPQAFAASFPEAVSVNKTYDVLCFLDPEIKQAVYVVVKEGSASCVLAICALYNWPMIDKSGQTLHSEDVQLVSEPVRKELIAFGTAGKSDGHKLLDLYSCLKK